MQGSLHVSEVGINTVHLQYQNPNATNFWVALIPAASKQGSISLRNKLGLAAKCNLSDKTPAD